MRKLTHTPLASPTVHRWPHLFIRFYSRTFRLRVVNEDAWQQVIAAVSPVLLGAWHQQFFRAIRHFINYKRSRLEAIVTAHLILDGRPLRSSG